MTNDGIDFIFLDRIYRIDGIFFAFGEEPFRPKAVLSWWSCWSCPIFF